MRAAVYESYGAAADVLRIVDIDRPEPGPGEVRVRIEAVRRQPDGLEVAQRDHAAAHQRISRCRITTGTGVIDAVGEGVDRNRVGQRVWTWMAAAERPVGHRGGVVGGAVPAGSRVCPTGLPPSSGRCLGRACDDRAPVPVRRRARSADKNVLVAGGAGAVGHFAIELAKHGGARVVSHGQRAGQGRAGRPRRAPTWW